MTVRPTVLQLQPAASQSNIIIRTGGGFYYGSYWCFTNMAWADGSAYYPDLLLNRGWCWPGETGAPVFPGDTGNDGSPGGHAGPKNPTETNWAAPAFSSVAPQGSGGWQWHRNMFVTYSNTAGGYTPDQNPAIVHYDMVVTTEFMVWDPVAAAPKPVKSMVNATSGDGVGEFLGYSTTYDNSPPIDSFNGLRQTVQVAQPLYYTTVGDGYHSVDSVPANGGICQWGGFCNIAFLTIPALLDISIPTQPIFPPMHV